MLNSGCLAPAYSLQTAYTKIDGRIKRNLPADCACIQPAIQHDWLWCKTNCL